MDSGNQVLPDIFLSYNRDDQPTARRFAEGFERAGFSVWWDQTLDAGEDYDKVTEKALAEARAVVVLWSKKSVDSRWVRAEATQADRTGTLVPAMIEACKRPIMFELKQTADLTHWTGDSTDGTWQAFLAGVKRMVEKGQPANTNPGAVAGAAVALPTPKLPRRSFGMWLVVAAVAVLGIGFGWWAINRNSSDSAVSAAVAGNKSVTLAVLPFVNLSSDPEQEYFSDGLTEEILNQLAQIKALRVTGRTSSFSFKGKNEDLRVIGEKLGVANLLEGSIRKDGNQLRITAQLINSKDGAHQWSQTYARELKDVFSIQEDIAKDVARAMRVTLDVGDLNRSQGGTTNVEAYDRYLRGRELLLRDERSASGQSVEQFREAVTLDPTFSRAWLGLSRALQTRAVFMPGEGASLLPEIERANERVKNLAPGAWWAKLLVADEMRSKRKWADAEEAINAALADIVDRQVPTEVAYGYLEIMWSLGRVKEGLVLGERAMAQDPLAMNLARAVQAMLDCAGRPADAQAEHDRVKALVGWQGSLEFWTLARMLMRDDVDASSIRAQLSLVSQGRPSGGNDLTRWLSEHFTDRASAMPEVRKAFEDPATQGVVSNWAVAMYADRFGDKNLALAALRKTVLLQPLPVNVLWWPQKTGLRSEPRFKDLVRELGLVDYWRASGKWGDYCRPAGNDDFECT
ncbi:MAG: TIR domain-containing protein [Pseudomonadota bacterium]